jgi:hypothetical protein
MVAEVALSSLPRKMETGRKPTKVFDVLYH